MTPSFACLNCALSPSVLGAKFTDRLCQVDEPRIAGTPAEPNTRCRVANIKADSQNHNAHGRTPLRHPAALREAFALFINIVRAS